MTYGYVRVSTKEQIVDRQLVAMKAAGVVNVTIDKASGKDFDRPQYQALRKKLKRGDLLVVQSLDRFGRSYDDIIDEWRYIVKSVGADVRVLDMPLLDTRQGEGLIGRFVGDIVLQILSFVAETERQKIKERQAQGIACAKARGVRFGRPRAQLPDNIDTLVERYRSGELSLRAASEEAGMSSSTFFRVAGGRGTCRVPRRAVRQPRPQVDPLAKVRAYLALPASERYTRRDELTKSEQKLARELYLQEAAQ